VVVVVVVVMVVLGTDKLHLVDAAALGASLNRTLAGDLDALLA
jgi:Sec-independent protein translocase protein TatA